MQMVKPLDYLYRWWMYWFGFNTQCVTSVRDSLQ